jgi:hypothetical protein
MVSHTSSTTNLSGTPLPKKLGLKEEVTFVVIGADQDYVKLLGGLPRGAKQAKVLREGLGFIHFFTRSQDELKKNFLRLRKSLTMDGVLWISWPKGSSGVKTDLNENRIREIGLENGLVDIKVCAVDETWSGLKFVYRLKDRKGKR